MTPSRVPARSSCSRAFSAPTPPPITRRRRPRRLDLLAHLVVGVEGARRERSDLDVVGAEQPCQLGEDARGDRHRPAAAQERRADPVDEDRQPVLPQPRDRPEPREEGVDHQCPRPGLDDRVDVAAGDVRRVEDVIRDRGLDRPNPLRRRPLQLVVLDEDGAARGELGGDRSRLRGGQAERRLHDRPDRDARLGRERRARQPRRPLHLDEPARLDVAPVGPFAGDAGGEELLGARLPVERRELDRHALSLDLHHARAHPLRPVGKAHRLEGRERLAPGRRPDFVNRAHRRIVGPSSRPKEDSRWQ